MANGVGPSPSYSVRVYRAEEERLHIVGDLIAALKTFQGGLQLNRRERKEILLDTQNFRPFGLCSYRDFFLLGGGVVCFNPASWLMAPSDHGLPFKATWFPQSLTLY